jgi:hypothetical protein
MTKKLEVKLKIANQGLFQNINDLKDLQAPEDTIKKTIKICKDFNEKSKPLRINYLFLLFPVCGIVLFVITLTVIPSAFRLFGFIPGATLIFSFNIYLCVIGFMWNKKFNETLHKINDESKKVIRAEAKYRFYTVRTKKARRTRKALESVKFKVILHQLEKHNNTNGITDKGSLHITNQPIMYSQKNLNQIKNPNYSNPQSLNNTGIQMHQSSLPQSNIQMNHPPHVMHQVPNQGHHPNNLTSINQSNQRSQQQTFFNPNETGYSNHSKYPIGNRPMLVHPQPNIVHNNNQNMQMNPNIKQNQIPFSGQRIPGQPNPMHLNQRPLQPQIPPYGNQYDPNQGNLHNMGNNQRMPFTPFPNQINLPTNQMVNSPYNNFYPNVPGKGIQQNNGNKENNQLTMQVDPQFETYSVKQNKIDEYETKKH